MPRADPSLPLFRQEYPRTESAERPESLAAAGEIEACRWWYDIERDLVQPKLVVALGATAVQAVLGSKASITSLRSKAHPGPDGINIAVTVHPCYLLRMPVEDAKRREFSRFVRDLERIGELVPELKTVSS